MLKGAYEYKNGAWTLFTNGTFFWTTTETDVEYLTRNNFESAEAFARSSLTSIQNEMLKVLIFTQKLPNSHIYEICLYVKIRGMENRGMMALVSNMNDLVTLLSLLEPVVSFPLVRQYQILAAPIEIVNPIA
jgi:hypothetical protein